MDTCDIRAAKIALVGGMRAPASKQTKDEIDTRVAVDTPESELHNITHACETIRKAHEENKPEPLNTRVVKKVAHSLSASAQPGPSGW